MPQSTQKNNQKTSPQDYIRDWMISFVEKPHPLLGDMPPCPYAQRARLENKVSMRWISQAEPDSNFWTHTENTDFNKTDVLILITDTDRWTCNEAYAVRCEMNHTFRRDDIVVLEDHPDYKEKIGKVEHEQRSLLSNVCAKKEQTESILEHSKTNHRLL
jgi:hypothetical protein